MRYTYKYKINSTQDLVDKLLTKSKTINYISILSSNQEKKGSVFPKKYINYDLIAGVGKLDELKCNDNSFQTLRTFHNQHSDWMFGYLSYDLKNEVEDLDSKNKDGIKANVLSFFIPTYVLLLKGNKLEVLTFQSKDNTDIFLNSLSISKNTKPHTVKLGLRENKKEYIEKIRAIKKHIQRGDIYEMNYCSEYFAENVSIDSEELFRSLNKITKTPFSAFFHLKEHYIMCASPERFLKKAKAKVITQPIKGTIKRGGNAIEDEKLIRELKNSQKDISENVMITDLVRNDLSITAKKATVKVEELCRVYTFKKVHQMISTVSSQVSKEVHFTDLLKTVFPMGSMTGSPKLKAMELIEQYELFKRGIFSGAVGYITPIGEFDFNVIIRTILYNANTKYLSVGVGGAITIKSDEEQEYEECLVKIKPIFEALNHKNEN